jgi:hypothetical protein
MSDDDKLPPGVIPVTPEMLDPWGPECDKAEDAPPTRDGDGWRGRIEGFCPVQGYGEVDGLTWYFRARHDAWSFEVWREPFQANGRLPEPDALWATFDEYGEGDHDASWMPFSHAWKYIEESIAKGRACKWSGQSESVDLRKDTDK